MGKILLINGSPHLTGHTAAALKKVGEMLAKEKGGETELITVPVDLPGCRDCGNQSERCNIDGRELFTIIRSKIEQADIVVFGTPVYLDMPTAQMVALLTRLNCTAELSKREFFRGKKAYYVATGYCSGTKAAIGIMRGACEMLGFDTPGRSSFEYTQKWDDLKVRGGMSEQAVWLD